MLVTCAFKFMFPFEPDLLLHEDIWRVFFSGLRNNFLVIVLRARNSKSSQNVILAAC